MIRQLTILGEAASRVSDATRRGLPEIPWQTVVGMRNVVVHQYDKIVLERIWLAVEDDLPDLARVLLRAVNRLEAPDNEQLSIETLTDDPGNR